MKNQFINKGAFFLAILIVLSFCLIDADAQHANDAVLDAPLVPSSPIR